MRRSTAPLLVPVLVLAAAAPTAAQRPRAPVRVTVTHVAGSTIYVDAGSAAGLAEGMTVDARADGGGPLGSLVVLGVTADRAGLTFQDRAFPITRGQTLVLEVPVPDAAADTAGAAGDTARVDSTGGRGGVAGRTVEATRGPGGLRAAGSVTLELETFRATSSWAEQVDGTVTQALVRPALRLRSDVTGLPGGFTASADLRVWHRGSSSSVYDPGTSLRVYRASLSRETGLVRVRAGRFWARELPFAAYWDGALMRVGGSAGAGVAVGFTPAGGAEGVDGDAPKLAAFVDYEQRGTGPETWGAVSFVQERLPREDTTLRTVGWTQRAHWGAVRVSHRVEWEPGGDDPITHANVDLAIDLPRGTRLTAGWLRDRYRPVQQVDGAFLPPRLRERASVGMAWSGSPGGVDVRAGVLGGDEDGHSLDGTAWAAPLRPWMPTVSLTSSYWADGDRSWLLVSPSFRRRFGPLDGRLAYHYYRIEDISRLRLHGGDVSGSFPLGAFRARLGVQGQWGADLVTLRLVSALSLRF